MSSLASVLKRSPNKYEGKLRDLDDFPIVESNYLVKNWLPKGKSISVFYGPPSVGKTFFALDMSFHVASGLPWYGNRVTQAPVTYICTEGTGRFGNRINAVRIAKPELHDKAIGRLRFLTEHVNFYKDAVDLNLLVEMHRDTVPPDLIIVDTVARAMSGADENTSRDMGKFVENLTKIGQGLNAHIIGIHHSGKGEERGPRGSNSLPASADTVLALEKTDDVIRVSQEKQRDGSTDFEFNYALKNTVLGQDKDGDTIESCVVEQAGPRLPDTQQKIAELLWSGSLRNMGICDALNMDKSNVSRDLKKMMKRKVVSLKDKSYHLNEENFATMTT